MKRFYLITILSFSTFLIPTLRTEAQPDSLARTIKIGVKDAPPFIIKDEDAYKGLGFQSWEMVNAKLGYTYELVPYESIEGLLAGIENGDVDMSINPITVTPNRMKKVDFSQPYFISQTSIARKSDSWILTFIQNIISWQFFSALALLLSIIFVFGLLVWFFERKKNDDFTNDMKGIGSGFWWSAVTMTTVGYGDKAPRTRGGRTIGFIWMFIAIILISSLTAGIASALTVQSINEKITSFDDLNRFKAGTVKASSTAEVLKKFGIRFSELKDLDEGLDQIKSGKLDVLVYDRPILKYMIEEQGLADDIIISSKALKKDYYSYAFPKNSPFEKPVNLALIEVLKTTEWQILESKYE